MTTNRQTLIELAERCEQAAGADRELDVSAAWANGWTETVHGKPEHNIRSCVSPDGREYPHGLIAHAPAYTASIDAALSLVPDGWVLRLSQIRFGLWHVQLWRGDKSFRQPCDVESCAATPALALCAAALRARAAMMEEDDAQ